MIGTALSVIIRIELAAPGVQILQGDHQLYNVIISSHALIMIFFMVKFYFCKSLNLTIFFLIMVKNNFINSYFTLNNLFSTQYCRGFQNKQDKYEPPYNYKTVIITDPYNNRDKIAKCAKGAKGIYIFKTVSCYAHVDFSIYSSSLNNSDINCYVGSSINLYSRVCSYFNLRRSLIIPRDFDLSYPKTLNPWFVTGFCDAESSFYVVISKTNTVKLGWAVKAVFEIHLHKKDALLLTDIQSFLGGIGNINEKANSVSLKIQTRDLNILINHFDKYPLITKKHADFELFKRVVKIINSKSHLNIEGLNEIVSLKASMNKGLSNKILSSFSSIQPKLRPLVNKPVIPDSMWVAGFVSGEGSFNISIGKSSNTKTGYKVGLRFQITQHSRDTELLKLFIDYFNCGGIYSPSHPRKDKVRNPEIVNYIVSNLSEISDKIVPFFKKYPILGNKELDFADFYKALNLIKNKKHLEESGLYKIKELKQGMNRGRDNS